MKHEKIFRLVLTALFAAMSCAATMLIHIPIPVTNGYINPGDAIVLLGALLLGPVYGAAAGGFGSMLADLLLGYAAYAPGTLLIKAAMAFFAALLFRRLRGKYAAFFACAAGELIMVLGYFAYESLILGFGLAAAAAIFPNTLQAVGGLILGLAAYRILSSVPAIKRVIS